ncbi:MAG: hypothetical protein AAF687_06455 [Pseudomonadota bacterium]
MTKNLVFIASGGRTGTNFFGDQLRECIADCWSEHEPDMFAGISELTAERIRRFGLKHMILDRVVGKTGLRILGTKYMLGQMSFDDAAAQLRKERASYHADIEQSLVIESYCRWWMFAGDVQRIFPGSKTVAVVRDPRTWIASWQSHHPRMGYVPWSHHFPPGPLTPAKMGDKKNATRWEAMGPVGRLAWHWNVINTTLADAAERDDSTRLFKFEDLFGGNETVLRELADYCSTFEDRSYDVTSTAALHQPKKNASKAGCDDWTRWSEGEKALVNEICGATMKRCGYEPLPVDVSVAA